MTIERFVLIDNDEDDLFFHERALKQAGFQGKVIGFQRPTEAISFLLDDQIAQSTCVLLDISMPTVSGFDVARELSQHLTPRARLKVVVVTASEWDHDREEAMSIPMINGYLVKPFESDDAQALLACCGQHQDCAEPA
jgi:CheY-like chemotaxis protein